MTTIPEFYLHLYSHLFTVIMDYGPWVYGILFLVIFIETGCCLAIAWGDSLLLAAGTLRRYSK